MSRSFRWVLCWIQRLSSSVALLLMKGFCKNDKNHDVRLKVEAIRVTDSKVKTGEGFFAIYPRTNAPRINLFAGPDEDLYCYSGIMALLRVQNDFLAMHCGRLCYSVAFHQTRHAVLNASRSSENRIVQFTSGDPVPVGAVAMESPKEEIGESGLKNLPAQQDPEFENSEFENSTDVQQQMDNVNSYHPDPDLLDTVNPANPNQDVEAKSHTSSKSTPPSPQSEAQPNPFLIGRPIFSIEDIPLHSPEPFLHTQVPESPPTREGPAHSLPQDSHVSRPGAESLSVIVHGATSLPPLSDGGVPLPFVIVRSQVDGPCGWRSHAVTRCPLQPTHNPWWEEKLWLELQDGQTPGKDVTLSVADGRTKELLACYRLPVWHLHPFHHYHLELVQSPRTESSETRLYVTMVRKLSLLPRQPCFFFTGFEVLLQSMDKPLKDPVGSLIAVARIVADYDLHRATGVPVNSVWFPDPPASAFTVPPLTAHGWPQVSLAGSPQEQPVWNHCFLFLGRDCASVFTGGAALILQFFPTVSGMSMGGWNIRSPVASSALVLDQSLYRKLMSARGLRVPHLPLQGCLFLTTCETPPTISLVIRLIGSECPDSFLTEVDCSVLPCLHLELQKSISTHDQSLQPRPESETEPLSAPPHPDSHTHLVLPLERDSYDLPSHDALSRILSEYLHIKKPKAQTRTQPAQQKINSQLDHTFDVQSLPVPDLDDEAHASEVAEHQTKELENYRTAMLKMADDIMALRSQVSGLESENSQLRSDLSLHQDLGRSLLDDTDLDVMTKSEIADRIASLKFKLASESSRASAQKDRIQQLQNELIRKNDIEKEFIQLQRAHQQQQAVLKRYQTRSSKIATLEDTVRQQEKVIEKMEKILDTKLRERNKGNSEKKKLMKHKDEEEDKMREIESVLAIENSRLREELDRLRNQPPPVIIQQPVQTHQPISDSEKLELLTQLARAEGRIQSLEQQLKENSKQWGKEKQEMLTRLSEYEHGFARTSTMIIHDLPVKSVTDSVLGRVRHRQLDPLK